jgi:hypothetical protein
LAESLDEFFKEGMDFELKNGNMEGDAINNAGNIANMFSFAEDEDLNLNNIAMYLGDEIDALFGDIFVPPGPTNDGQDNNDEQHPPAAATNHHHTNQNLPAIEHAHHLANSARNILATLDGRGPTTSTSQQQHQQAASASGGAQSSMVLQPGQVIMLPNGQTVQLVLQPPSNNNNNNMMGGGHYNNTYSNNIGGTGTGMELTANNNNYPRSASNSPIKQTSQQKQQQQQQQPPKRRRAPNGTRAPSYTETAAQRSARLAQGFSFDPTTGRMFRHGPALIAAAKQDRDVPPVNDVFEAFSRQPFGVDSPPGGPAGGPEESAGNIDDMSILSDGFPEKPKQQRRRGEEGAGGGRMPPGHGSITNLVTQELRSAPVPPSAGGHNNNASHLHNHHSQHPGAAGPEGSTNLLGVSRDKWNLFWDAWVMSPANAIQPSSITEGFKEEAIHLGKFPTQAQAGRARDIATLKLFGPTNEMNFPVDTYRVAISVLQAHSGEEVVEALRKDSQLALQRTTKYKGVRRVGPGCFEATAPAETAIGM